MNYKDVNRRNIVSVEVFLNDYVLPYYGSRITSDEMINKLKNCSHLDLDELEIPCVKRCSDEEAITNPSVIFVEAKGRGHRGLEVHGYYRPFDLMKEEYMEEGLSEIEAVNFLLSGMRPPEESDVSNRINFVERKRKKKIGKRN